LFNLRSNHVKQPKSQQIMTLQQTIKRLSEERKRVLGQMYSYQRRLEEANRTSLEAIPLEVIDLDNTVNFLDQKQILLLKIQEELKKITHL
jgi:hypothetical protein